MYCRRTTHPRAAVQCRWSARAGPCGTHTVATRTPRGTERNPTRRRVVHHGHPGWVVVCPFFSQKGAQNVGVHRGASFVQVWRCVQTLCSRNQQANIVSPGDQASGTGNSCEKSGASGRRQIHGESGASQRDTSQIRRIRSQIRRSRRIQGPMLVISRTLRTSQER